MCCTEQVLGVADASLFPLLQEVRREDSTRRVRSNELDLTRGLSLCVVSGSVLLMSAALHSQGGSLEGLLSAAEGGAHWPRRASAGATDDGTGSTGKKKAER